MAEEFDFRKPREDVVSAEAEESEILQSMAEYFIDSTVLLKDRGLLNEDANLWPDRDKEDLDVNVRAYSVDLPDGYVERFSDENDRFFAYGAVSRPSDFAEKGEAPIFVSDTVLSELNMEEVAGYLMHEVVEVQNGQRPEMRNKEAQLRTARNLRKIDEYRNEIEDKLGSSPLNPRESNRAVEYSQRMGEYFWF